MVGCSPLWTVFPQSAGDWSDGWFFGAACNRNPRDTILIGELVSRRAFTGHLIGKCGSKCCLVCCWLWFYTMHSMHHLLYHLVKHIFCCYWWCHRWIWLSIDLVSPHHPSMLASLGVNRNVCWSSLTLYRQSTTFEVAHLGKMSCSPTLVTSDICSSQWGSSLLPIRWSKWSLLVGVTAAGCSLPAPNSFRPASSNQAFANNSSNVPAVPTNLPLIGTTSPVTNW